MLEIEIRDLVKAFENNAVLKGINLRVEAGKTVVVIGPSGSGKSTLLRCINFLEEPTQGSVTIGGTTLSSKTLSQLRPKTSMVFQHFNLFNNMTVLENIIYAPINVLKIAPHEANENAIKRLQQVGLEDKKHTYPHNLSGGQKQRVAILRALAVQPEIMLFDEPTSALDPEMVKEVLELIQSLSHTGMTIVMNTHEMAFAQEVADEIVFLDHGKILEQAPPDAFFNNPQNERVKSFLEKVL